MNTTELTELMRDATDDLEPRPGFHEQVLHGGRRRRLRRRFAAGASAVAVVAVAAGATVVAFDTSAPAPPAATTDARLTTPTRGDLAGDATFLGEVKEKWRTELGYAAPAYYRYFDDRRGEPHVYWAGNTQAGPAAVVMQEVYIHADHWVPKKDEGSRTAVGLVAVDPADGQLKLVGTNSPTNPRGRAEYYSFGPGDRMLLILDEGKPLHYAYSIGSGPGTPPPNEWHRAQPEDGVALVELPEGVYGMATVAYQGDDPPDPASGPAAASIGAGCVASVYLQLRLPAPDHRIAYPTFLPWEDVWTFGSTVSDLHRRDLETHTDVDRLNSQWMIVVGLSDRVVLLKETQPPAGEHEARLTAAIGTIEGNDLNVAVVDAGVADEEGVLPVRFRIPDGGGWLVAARGKPLSYRTAPDGQWLDAGKDAALLPDDAVEVKVGDETVRL